MALKLLRARGGDVTAGGRRALVGDGDADIDVVTPNDTAAVEVDMDRHEREREGDHKDEAGAEPLGWTPVGPPKVRSRNPLRQTMTAVCLVALFGLVTIAATTLLGKNASQKFSSVAMACAVIQPPLAVVGFGDGGGGEHELATGCGDAGAVASSSAGQTPASVPADVLSQAGRATASSAAPAPPAAAVASAPAEPAPSPLDAGPAAGHAFISTATMTVKVDDVNVVNQKKEEAVALVEGSGGGLFGEQTSFNGGAHATVTFKVPPARFRPLLSSLAALGALQEQEVKTDDVTQQVIDLDARIVAAQDGLDRMRGLLAKASDLNQVATLEADVSRRQTELEQLKGEQQTLGQRVDLATIVLTITDGSSTGPGGTTPPVVAGTSGSSPTTTAAPKPLPGFGDGLENGWHVFTTVGTVVLACLGAALPFLPFLVVALVTWRLVRRRRSISTPNAATAT
jgi:hypothetical protein